MYESFFGLTEKPFAITPDPRYLYLSERHAEALAHLAYGIQESGGFIQLTGEVGTGKTMVVRSLLQQLPANCDMALILNPRITPAEFLLAICDELHVAVPERLASSVKGLVDLLTRFLLDAHARGRRVVVMVDEAQNLSPDVLEQVRLLTNLETATQKLLQIILVGQPELRDVLTSPDLRQLAQRITGRYHLEALSRSETQAYVRHRLRVAGAAAEIFTAGALREVHRVSGGIPRIINVVCDRALLGAFTREEHRVTGDLIRNAASEVYGRPVLHPWVRWLALAGAGAGVALLGLALWRAFPPEAAPPAEPAAAVAVEPAEAVEPPPPAEAPPPSLESLLAREAAGTTTDAAFAGLLRLWGASYEPGSARPCDQVAAQGLQCVAQRGSFAQLRLINRPAILSLADASGAEHQVVIERLDDEGARLAIGSVPYTVSLAELANHWFGEFLVVWRPSQPAVKDLRLGMRGEDVRWLRQGLAQVGGLPAESAAGDTFDAGVERLVEEFQRARRLAVDGIAGMQTQLLLDSAIGAPGTPTLLAEPAGGGA
ncbi:MAG: AAA family ATPase [Steroidobacteraceae bacterium]|jgi:general secretion pathway protein A|nr:AAA family ATPase [Steroidobacteraceae bacterium]